MSRAIAPQATQAGEPQLPIVAAALAATLILVIAGALGNPTPASITLLGLIVAIVTAITIAARPFTGYLILVGSCITLLVVMVMPGRGANAFDALLLPILAGTYWGRARREARESDRRQTGAGHETIRDAGHRLSRATILYYSVAALSLLVTALRGHPEGALSSSLNLVRALQGILLFPIGMIWLRSERRIHAVIGAVLVGAGLFIVANSVAATGDDFKRAGQTWHVHALGTPAADPNEAATAMLLVWALLVALRAAAPSAGQLILMPMVLAMLVLTQSRSGLLAWLVFTTLSLKGRQRWFAAGLAVLALALLPIVAPHYVERISRTLMLERGSFEAYSSLIRVYAWRAAWAAFLDHPFFGVGYLGFRHFSDQYNQLRAMLGTAESLYLEVATGMGVVGLVLLGNVIVRMIQAGRAVLRVAPPSSLGHHLARLHLPFVAGLLAASLTGDNLFGLVGLAQLALWNALVLRAGHESLDAARRA